jgi:hypothetical protein
MFILKCHFLYSCALIFLAFFRAYLHQGIQVWKMPTNESLHRYMSQPEKDVSNVNFSYLLYANDHFTLLRKAVDGYHEPTEPNPRGRPVGTTSSDVLSSTVHSPISHERKRPPTEEEEANEVWEGHDKRTKEEKSMTLMAL